MLEILCLILYLAGWIVCVRLLVKFYNWDTERDGYFTPGGFGLFWPIILAIAVPIFVISGIAWLATRGLGGKSGA